MVCVPTLKQIMHWDTRYKSSKDILCSEEKLLMEYEVVGYQKGWYKTSCHALRVASECLKDYLTVSRHHNKPIRGGTNSGCIDRIDNIAPIQFPRWNKPWWSWRWDQQDIDDCGTCDLCIKPSQCYLHFACIWDTRIQQSHCGRPRAADDMFHIEGNHWVQDFPWLSAK